MKQPPQERTTLLAYVDESGDTGSAHGGTSLTYTLGCVLVEANAWSSAFDSHLAFRRRLKKSFGLPARAELKANHLIRSGGVFKQIKLAPGQRSLIYRAALDWMHETPGVHAFAVVSHKTGGAIGAELLTATWTPLLQRLERTSREWQNSSVFILHDEGENTQIRKLGRWSRRRLGAGSITNSGSISTPFLGLLDDPQPKASHESYFLQMADLVAYAAWRRLYVPSDSVAAVAPQRLWDSLGDATLSAVTSLRPRTSPGIVELRS